VAPWLSVAPRYSASEQSVIIAAKPAPEGEIMKPRWTKWLWLSVPGCVTLQYAGCFGGDPEYFFTSTVANAVVYNLVSALFEVILSGLTAAPAMLLG
jgi:hypothetical protein